MKKLWLILVSIFCLNVTNGIAHNEFYIVQNHTITEKAVSTSYPMSGMLHWDSSIWSQLPIDDSQINSTAADMPTSLDASLTLSQYKAARQTWIDACPSLGYNSTTGANTIGITWTTDPSIFFGDATTVGGITYLAAYDGEFAVDMSSGFSDTQFQQTHIWLNNTPDFTNPVSGLKWTNNFTWPSWDHTWYYCFQHAILHELGHLCGLSHCIEFYTIMYKYQDASQNGASPGFGFQTWLTSYDQAGINLMCGIVTSTCSSCPPDPPANFQADISNTDVVLTWDPIPAGLNVNWVDLYVDNNRSILPAYLTSYTCQGAATTLPHTYAIGYENSNGIGPPSLPVSVTASGPTISQSTNWGA